MEKLVQFMIIIIIKAITTLFVFFIFFATILNR